EGRAHLTRSRLGRHGSAGDVEEAGDVAPGCIPGLDCLWCWGEQDGASVLFEEAVRFEREVDHAVLPAADDQTLRLLGLPVHALDLGERDRVRGPVDGLGELLLALAHLAVWEDDDVVAQLLAADRDRAELGALDSWLHHTS